MSETTKNVYQRLLEVQKELRAPRSLSGRFGSARSAEQILADAKPVVNKHGLYLHTSDVIEQVGDRNYITTTATVVNVDTPTEQVHASASAWEGQVVSGLDTSQVSGKTSSYAKKYALQNLFAIDDTTDADFKHDDPDPKVPTKINKWTPSDDKEVTDDQRMFIASHLRLLHGVVGKEMIDDWLDKNWHNTPETQAQAQELIDSLNNEKTEREAQHVTN